MQIESFFSSAKISRSWTGSKHSTLTRSDGLFDDGCARTRQAEERRQREKSESAPIVHKINPGGLDPSKAGRKTSGSEVEMFLTLRLGLLSLFAATLCSKAEPVPIPQIVAMP
jgi:hypothetical protein